MILFTTEISIKHRIVLNNYWAILGVGNIPSKLLVNQLIVYKNTIQLSDEEWELLLRQARAAGVISRLAFFWKEFGLLAPPNFVAPHLNSAYKYWMSQKRLVNWELYNLQQIFEQLQLPLILLKGTAYLAANLNAGLGRVFSDIDILVPKHRLQDVKERLKWHGWYPEKMDGYDRRYYERWMHELPPMRHVQRGTTLDVHHNILPETCTLCPEAELLLKAAVKIPGSDCWVLAPEDMILHSASHLFWGGEFDNGLRDLSDMDLLLREFSRNDMGFWQKLLGRANVLGMARPLFYALRYSVKMLHTPVPDAVLQNPALTVSGGFKNRVMDMLFIPALMPIHPSCSDRWTGFARWLLYIRSHWLKMPWYLLILHLSRKAWMRLTGKEQH
ncbi:nucleotidyltransferase family protein [Methylomonas sp. LL1]|nr:nucleotidyltransferase family protein [Methylomonas sp. LL1]